MPWSTGFFSVLRLRSAARPLSAAILKLRFDFRLGFPYKVGMSPEAHNYCFEQAATILVADKRLDKSHPMLQNEMLQKMKEGSHMADFASVKPFPAASFRTHYHRPKSHKGYLPGIPSAADTCSEFVELASICWWNACYMDSMLYFGAASHMVQDLCVPFHTTHRSLRKHINFERRLDKYFHKFSVENSGIYDFSAYRQHHDQSSGAGWVDYAAHQSVAWLADLLKSDGNGVYDIARKIMPLAQRLTAGFIFLFAQKIELWNTVDGDTFDAVAEQAL